MTKPAVVTRAFRICRVKPLIHQAGDEGSGQLRVDPVLCAILGSGLIQISQADAGFDFLSREDGKRRHVVVHQVFVLVIADHNQYVGIERIELLTQLGDGFHATVPFGPFYL